MLARVRELQSRHGPRSTEALPLAVQLSAGVVKTHRKTWETQRDVIHFRLSRDAVEAGGHVSIIPVRFARDAVKVCSVIRARLRHRDVTSASSASASRAPASRAPASFASASSAPVSIHARQKGIKFVGCKVDFDRSGFLCSDCWPCPAIVCG